MAKIKTFMDHLKPRERDVMSYYDHAVIGLCAKLLYAITKTVPRKSKFRKEATKIQKIADMLRFDLDNVALANFRRPENRDLELHYGSYRDLLEDEDFQAAFDAINAELERNLGLRLIQVEQKKTQ